MDRIALATRLEGLSKVFASSTPYHRDLKAMAEVLTKVADDKFKTILSSEFLEETEAGVGGGSGLVGMLPGAQHGGNLPSTSATPHGHTSIYDGLSNKVKSQLSPAARAILQAAPPSEGAVAPVPAPVKEAAGLVPMHSPAQRGDSLPSSTGIGGKHLSIYDGLSDKIKAELQSKAPGDIALLQAEQAPALEPTHAPDFAQARKTPTIPGLVREEEATMTAEASTGMYWNIEASDAVLNNLLRDVVGMDKSICCDTGRKLDKDQKPDGSHKGEKAPTLKPEQTPDQQKSLDSGIVEKSHGKVQKEATEQVKVEEKDASLSDIEKAKKEKEQEATKKKVDELAKAKAKKEKDSCDDKEAGVEGDFELESSMDDVVLDAAEQEKLSQLFA
jgi:hypothetical protein